MADHRHRGKLTNLFKGYVEGPGQQFEINSRSKTMAPAVDLEAILKSLTLEEKVNHSFLVIAKTLDKDKMACEANSASLDLSSLWWNFLGNTSHPRKGRALYQGKH